MVQVDSYENVQVDQHDGVVHVTMASTSRFNALNLQMARELSDVATALATADDVRCVTLTGSDGVYSSGADLSQFDGDESDATALRAEMAALHEAVLQLHQSRIPVVGGINGVAAGAGFSLAIVPDFVVISEDARLEFAYSRIGLTGDGGATHLLPRLVGLRRATEIALLDDPIGPERAVELGLATEAVPAGALDERVEELATRLASGPTRALGATARLLRESQGRSLAEHLAAEAEAMADATRTEDYARGLAAFGTDEEPEFTGQ